MALGRSVVPARVVGRNGERPALRPVDLRPGGCAGPSKGPGARSPHGRGWAVDVDEGTCRHPGRWHQRFSQLLSKSVSGMAGSGLCFRAAVVRTPTLTLPRTGGGDSLQPFPRYGEGRGGGCVTPRASIEPRRTFFGIKLRLMAVLP